jgi:hypothetical protein
MMHCQSVGDDDVVERNNVVHTPSEAEEQSTLRVIETLFESIAVIEQRFVNVETDKRGTKRQMNVLRIVDLQRIPEPLRKFIAMNEHVNTNNKMHDNE